MQVPQDLGTFILPGSKRLITDQAMFGNNLDVLPPEPKGATLVTLVVQLVA